MQVCRRYETKVFKQSMGSYCTEEEAARAVDLGYQFVGLDPPNASDFPDDGIENVAIEVEGAFEVYLARIAAVRENPLLAKPAKRCRAVAEERAWCSAAVKAKSRDVMWAVQKLVLTRAARDDLLQVWLWLRSRSRAAITLRDVAGLIFDVRVQLFESGGDVVRAFVRSAVGMGAQVTSLDAELGAFLRSEPTGMVPKEELHEWRDKTFSPYAWDPPSTKLGVMAASAVEPPVSEAREKHVIPRANVSIDARRRGAANTIRAQLVGDWAAYDGCLEGYMAELDYVNSEAAKVPTKSTRNLHCFYNLNTWEGILRRLGTSLSVYSTRPIPAGLIAEAFKIMSDQKVGKDEHGRRWRSRRGILHPVVYERRHYLLSSLSHMITSMSIFCRMNGQPNVIQMPALRGPLGIIQEVRRSFVAKRVHVAHAITIEVLYLLLASLDFSTVEGLFWGSLVSSSVFYGMRAGDAYFCNWEDFDLDNFEEGLTWRQPFGKSDQEGQSLARTVGHREGCKKQWQSCCAEDLVDKFCHPCLFEALWRALCCPREGPVFATRPGYEVGAGADKPLRPAEMNAALRCIVEAATSGDNPVIAAVEAAAMSTAAGSWERRRSTAIGRAMQDLLRAMGEHGDHPFRMHGGRRGGAQTLISVPEMTLQLLTHWGRWKTVDSAVPYIAGNRTDLHDAAMKTGLMHSVWQSRSRREESAAVAEETLKRVVAIEDAVRGRPRPGLLDDGSSRLPLSAPTAELAALVREVSRDAVREFIAMRGESSRDVLPETLAVAPSQQALDLQGALALCSPPSGSVGVGGYIIFIFPFLLLQRL